MDSAVVFQGGVPKRLGIVISSQSPHKTPMSGPELCVWLPELPCGDDGMKTAVCRQAAAASTAAAATTAFVVAAVLFPSRAKVGWWLGKGTPVERFHFRILRPLLDAHTKLLERVTVENVVIIEVDCC
jgi:hypothetical protein